MSHLILMDNIQRTTTQGTVSESTRLQLMSKRLFFYIFNNDLTSIETETSGFCVKIKFLVHETFKNNYNSYKYRYSISC